MSAVTPVLEFPRGAGADRRLTEAERAYVRAVARIAARAIFEAERSSATPNEADR